jgi:hypothetical protein
VSPVAAGVAGIAEATGATFAHISAARELTERRLDERRERFRAVEVDVDAAVVLTGSWGRREITSESDDDFIVLCAGPQRQQCCPSPREVAELLGARAPGREDVFGSEVWLEELREKIGRDEDTNTNLTRRMLLLLESVAVCHEDVHAAARRGLIERYLETGAKDSRPPRFLLNDLIRYWRTIAVDFESKMRARRGEGWGLRNAKLRLSRKALFAAGLLPVLECRRRPAAEMLDYLDERVAVPPLDRIADAFVAYGALDAGARVLAAYDEFLATLDDPAKRRELSEVSASDSGQSALFTRISELGKEFEAGLLALLFDEVELQRWVREYLIF